MDNRKNILLNMVVDSYVQTAEPVGSRFLLSSGKVDCGEATIRNELRALENEGYLTHPHTSAGRIPTEKGYRHYVENLDNKKIKLSKKENNVLGMSVKSDDKYKSSRKNLAKNLVELSNETIILAFSPDSIYYTGLANLFSKPEFNELQLVADVSAVFDHCENCLEGFFDQTKDKVDIYIGNEHPFGDMLSVVASRFSNDQVEDGLIALMGPMRMDYQKNLALVNKVKEII
jgi:heat-inducible transcriptional repressor